MRGLQNKSKIFFYKSRPMRIYSALVILLLVSIWIAQPFQIANAAGIDDVTTTLSVETVNTAAVVTVVFTFGTLIDTNVIKIYLGENTGGDEWQLNAIDTTDISCSDDGTGEVYTVNSVTAASATVPMWTQITATTVGTAATEVTCIIGDGAPNPMNPIGADGYSIAVVTTNDSGAGIAYVGNANDITVSATVLPNLTLTIGSADGTYCTTTAGVTTCNLGTVLTTTENDGSYDVDVGTNAASGATVNLAEDGNLRNGADNIDDVGDGDITAGSEEYGVVVTETGSAWTIDGTYLATEAPVITGPDVVATSTGPVDISTDNVDIIHRVAVATATKALTYTHIVTWTATANF